MLAINVLFMSLVATGIVSLLVYGIRSDQRGRIALAEQRESTR